MPGDIVIDAGAYLGYFSILAAKKVGKNGIVIAFEPSPSNFTVLKERVVKSGLTNIIPVNKALYNKNGRAFFSKEISSNSILKNQKAHIDDVEVESVTLDDELSSMGISKINFIKMDIEGNEIEALEGGTKTFNNTKNFAIACYHKRNNKITGEILSPVFKNMGFKTSIGFSLHPTLYGSKLS